jgi:hypothetical protein
MDTRRNAFFTAWTVLVIVAAFAMLAWMLAKPESYCRFALMSPFSKVPVMCLKYVFK